MLLFMNCNSIYELYKFDEDWSMSCGEHGSSGVIGVGTITTLDCFDILTSWSIILAKSSWMISACLSVNEGTGNLGWGGDGGRWHEFGKVSVFFYDM